MQRIAVIALLAAAGCENSSQIPDTCSEAEALRWVQRADVREDFRRHVVEQRDVRFISVYGLSFGTEFPGLENTPEMHRLVQEHGSRRIENTTDIISCTEQHQLLDEISHYARRYNSMILGYRERLK
jgi:hypothetical protein